MGATGTCVAENDEALCEGLTRGLSAALGRSAEVEAVRRTCCPGASSYEAQRLIVRLRGGDEVAVFFKNLGVSRFPKDDMPERRRREHMVYRDLLSDETLGTARFYGSVWDEPQGRYWLFLEYVEGVELRFCDVEHWIAAAAWLGRLHGYFRHHACRLGAGGGLVRHDAAFFRSKAMLALRQVSAASAILAQRLADALHDYDGIAQIMSGQPATLVHGHYRPCNILVRGGEPGSLPCPIDWEQASLGSALYDLAYLADGFTPPVLDQLFDAYAQEARAHGVVVPDRAEMRRIVNCYWLFMPLHCLSRGRERDLTPRRIARAVEQVERIRDEL